MALTSARVTVGTSAAALTATETDVVSGTRVTVTNRDATNSVDLGDSSVTSGAGYELKAGETVTFVLGAGEQLHAISAGSVRVDVLRTFA